MKPFIQYEGLWSKGDNRDYLRFPEVKEGAPWLAQQAFIASLISTQKNAEEASYRGFSCCRLCGICNGSKTYELTAFGVTWRWPQGYLHYIQDHNVRPSLAFQQFICAYSGDPMEFKA